MVDYDVQLKKRTDGIWDKLFPVTTTKNVIDKNKGKTLDKIINDFDNNFLKNENSIDYLDQKINQIVPITGYDVDSTGIKDSLSGFKKALNDLKTNEILVLEKDGNYLLSDMISVTKKGRYVIEGNGSTIKTDVVMTSPNVDGRGLEFKGIFVTSKIMNNNLPIGEDVVNVGNTSDLKVGQLLHFKSDSQFNSSRNYYKKGGTFTIGEIISNSEIRISGGFPYEIPQNCIINVYDPITIEIRNLTLVANKPLPSGRYGFSVFYGLDCVLDNVNVANFNHNFHLENHYNTMVQRVKSGKSYYSGSQESYGFASYMGTLLNIKNSQFISGRHALEISGYENSFKTTIENVVAYSEDQGFAFNTHQACYDLVARNSYFGSIGMCNNAYLENCFIGGQGNSVLKTSEIAHETDFEFHKCTFDGEQLITITNDAQNQNTTAYHIGRISIINCKTSNKLQLSLGVSNAQQIIDRIYIERTDNVETILKNAPLTVKDYVYRDSKFVADTQILNQNTETDFDSIVFENMYIMTRYNIIVTKKWNRFVFDNVLFVGRDGSEQQNSISSKNGATHTGRMFINNSDLLATPFATAGWDYLTVVNSRLKWRSGRTSVQNRRQTTFEDITGDIT